MIDSAKPIANEVSSKRHAGITGTGEGIAQFVARFHELSKSLDCLAPLLQSTGDGQPAIIQDQTAAILERGDRAE